MADKRLDEKNKGVTVTPAQDKDAETDAEERVRQGYEEAAHPEKQGDGDPSPLDVTES